MHVLKANRSSKRVANAVCTTFAVQNWTLEYFSLQFQKFVFACVFVIFSSTVVAHGLPIKRSWWSQCSTARRRSWAVARTEGRVWGQMLEGAGGHCKWKLSLQYPPLDFLSQREGRVTSKAALRRRVRLVHSRITVEYIDKLYASMPGRCLAMYEGDGAVCHYKWSVIRTGHDFLFYYIDCHIIIDMGAYVCRSACVLVCDYVVGWVQNTMWWLEASCSR